MCECASVSQSLRVIKLMLSNDYTDSIECNHHFFSVRSSAHLFHPPEHPVSNSEPSKMNYNTLCSIVSDFMCAATLEYNRPPFNFLFTQFYVIMIIRSFCLADNKRNKKIFLFQLLICVNGQCSGMPTSCSLTISCFKAIVNGNGKSIYADNHWILSMAHIRTRIFF